MKGNLFSEVFVTMLMITMVIGGIASIFHP